MVLDHRFSLCFSFFCFFCVVVASIRLGETNARMRVLLVYYVFPPRPGVGARVGVPKGGGGGALSHWTAQDNKIFFSFRAEPPSE